MEIPTSTKKHIQLESALVVLFHPEAHFWKYLELLSQNFKHVLLIDNTPSQENSENSNMLRPNNVSYHSMQENSGIATALNKGCEILFSQNSTYVVSFDQDTRIKENFTAVVQECMRLKDMNQSILGAGFRRQSFIPGLFSNTLDPLREVTTVISSGMLLSKTIFQQLGPFKDHYFIDSVDHEYCLRARNKGNKIYIINRQIMSHTIGQESQLIPVHPSNRKYYIFRNVVLTIRSFWRQESFWSLKQVFRLAFETLHVFFFETEKGKKCRAMLKGTLDGLHYKENINE